MSLLRSTRFLVNSMLLKQKITDPGTLTAHVHSLLVLLRSRPDTVRGRTLRETKVCDMVYNT